jgi:hypothetical protein
MFEPENDLERSLMRATSEPSHRAAFLRDLMDGEIFLALLIASGGAPIAGPDGKMVLSADAKLELSSVRRGEEVFLPFFTAPARAHAIIQGDHVIAPDKTRDLFARYPDAQFVLNPGSDYGKEFLREEVERLLRGDFGSDHEDVVVKKPTQVLIGQPAHYPTEVVTALTAIFQDKPSVDAAYLCQVAYPGEAPHLHVAVSATADWETVRQAMRPKLRAALPPDNVVDFAPLAGGAFEGYFRSETRPFFVRPKARS